jgi:hypothetical protein
MVRIAAMVSLLLLAGAVASLEAGDPKAEPFQRMGKAELEKLAGKWEHAFDTRSGWKGKLIARFKIVESRDKSFFLSVQYDCAAQREKEKFEVAINSGVQVALYSQGKAKYLVVNSAAGLIQDFDPHAKGNRVT